MRIYYCGENDQLYTETECRALYNELCASGDVDGMPYADYMNAATGKDGALAVIDTDFYAARALAVDFCAAGTTWEKIDAIARGLYDAGNNAYITGAIQDARFETTASAAAGKLAESIRRYIAARRLELKEE